MSDRNHDFCPDCEAITEQRMDYRREIHMIRNQPIEVPATVRVCISGKHDICDMALDDATLTRAYDEYRRQFPGDPVRQTEGETPHDPERV